MSRPTAASLSRNILAAIHDPADRARIAAAQPGAMIAPEPQKASQDPAPFVFRSVCELVEPSEPPFQGKVNQELTRRGVRAFLHLSARAREKAGWPDLVFVYCGRPCALELKAQGGRLSDDQIEVLTAMRQDGWRVAAVWSMDAVVEWLDAVREDRI